MAGLPSTQAMAENLPSHVPKRAARQHTSGCVSYAATRNLAPLFGDGRRGLMTACHYQGTSPSAHSTAYQQMVLCASMGLPVAGCLAPISGTCNADMNSKCAASSRHDGVAADVQAVWEEGGQLAQHGTIEQLG